MTVRSPLAAGAADSAACGRYDCGHIGRHAEQAVRQAGVLFRVVMAHGETAISGVSASAATLAALALMRQGVACSEVAERYRDPVTNRFVPAAPRREQTGLTDQQVLVLRALATGATPSDVGPRVHLSPQTVESHRKNIYRRLAVHSLGDAVAEAIRLGYPVL